MAAYRSAARGSVIHDDAMSQLAVAGVHLSDRELLVGLARELLQPAPAQSAVARGRALERVAHALLLVGEPQLCRSLMPALEAICEAAGDREPLLTAFLANGRHIIACFDGDLERGLDEIKRAESAFALAGDERNTADAHGNLGFCALQIGDYDLAGRALREFLAAAERLGLRNSVASAQHNLGLAMALQGELEEALVTERAALEHFVACGNHRQAASAHQYLATTLLLGGDLPAAEEEALQAVAAAGDSRQLAASAQATLAQVLLAQGRAAEALPWARRAGATLDELGGIEEREMNFLKLFLRTIALIPGVVQGTEALFGAKSGEQKKKAAVEIVGAAINVADAVTMKHIADADKFTEGLSTLIDGVVMCLNASLWAKQ